MLPVEALTRLFGVNPWLAAVGLAHSNASTETSLASEALLILRPEAITAPLTWSGVYSGCSWSRSATAPETTGAAIDVPPARMYCPLTMQVGHINANALLGASSETMCAPGASTSGFAKPSCVVPRLDQSASVSSREFLVPWSSTPPTEI